MRTEPVRPRSVHIIGSRASGGAERFYVRLVSALHRCGFDVLAVCPPGSRVARELGTGIPQRHVPMRSPLDPLARWRIHRLLKGHCPDIVQTSLGRATRLTRVAAGQHAIHVARLGGYYRLRDYRHAQAWIGVTRGICAYLVSHGLPPERVFHIGNFVPVPDPVSPDRCTALRAALGIGERAQVVTATGRLHPVKGFEDLLAAFSRLPARLAGEPVYLVIVGDGPLRASLQAETRRLAIDARVRWCGWQEEPDPYVGMADVVVCPSREEPLGNVILEAWSHGKSVVCTATRGGRELITDGVDGRLVPCRDPGRLATALQELLTDVPLQRQLGRGGLATVRTRHSEEQILRDYVNLYATLARVP